MSVLCPRQCIAMKGSRLAATQGTISGSARPPETSLTMEAPASTAARATEARIVSMDTTAPSAASAVTTGTTRRSSSSTDGRSAPGLVDSPPTSTMSAPAATTSRPCAMAASGSNHCPPSEKESGVTLTTPMTRVRSVTDSRVVASGAVRSRRADGADEADEADEAGEADAVMSAIVSRGKWWRSGPRSLVALEHQRHGLCSSGQVAQLAADRRGDGAGPGLADATHRHAQVLGLDDDDDALDVEVLDHRVGDLGREALLHLGAPGVDLDEAGELRQPGVPHDDELLVVDLERRAEDVGRGHVEPGVDFGERARHAARGGQQALAFRVLADGEEQLPHGRLRPCLVDRHPSALLVGVDGAVVRDLDDVLDGVLLGQRVDAHRRGLVDLVLEPLVGRHRRRQVTVLATGAVLRRDLGRRQHRRSVAELARLRREPGRALRRLGDRLEQLGQLVDVEGLLLEQLEDEVVEQVTVGVEGGVRLVVGRVDEGTDLLVDDARDLLGVVALVAHVAAEEDLAGALAELDGTDARGHAELGDHLAGHPGRLLDVVARARRRLVEDDLLGDAAAEGVRELVEDLVAGRGVLVVDRHDHRVAEGATAREDRDLRDRVGVVERRGDEGVTALVVGRDLALLGRHDACALLRTGDDAVDGLVEGLVVDDLPVAASSEQGGLVEDVGEVGAGEAGRATGDGEQVDV